MFTTYEDTHARTQGLHFEGRDRSGKRVIVDAAEMAADRFEVMAMRSNGREIACRTVEGLAEARRAFDELMADILSAGAPAPVPAPLTGKYAQLRDDLAAALAAGQQAEAGVPDDRGTCNFDCAAVCLPRWAAAKVERAAKDAGCACGTWSSMGSGWYTFAPVTRGQGLARTKNAEAMADALQRLGYNVTMYYQMD